MKAGLPIVALALTSVACQSMLAPCDPEVSVLGTWRYSAVQDAPAAARLSGTLDITGESCEGFEGRLDVLEDDLLGGTRRVAGPVSGVVISAGTVRFDAYIAVVPRQHIAALEADSIEGNWVAVGASSAPSLTGSFGARRTTLP